MLSDFDPMIINDLKIKMEAIMKLKLARFTAFLLCVVMLALPLASCGGGDETTKPKETVDGQTTQAWVADNLGDLNYGGEETVRILSRGDDWFFDELSLEPDEVMNIIDESVNERELYVEERLGIDIKVQKEMCGTDYDKLADLTRTYFESNTDVFDILAGHCYHVMQLTTQGILWDLNEVDNMELDQPWYAQNFVDLSTINDQIFFVTGDAALTLMRFAFVTFVNMEMADTYGVENIYKVVDDKQWTLDYLSSTVSNIYDDLNANGTSDEGDLFGFATSDVTGIDMFWSSFDLDILGKDETGALVNVIDSDKCASATSALVDLYFTNNGVHVPAHGSGDTEYETMMTAFAGDQYLFTNLRLISVEGEQFINMESKYGIIPTPLWNADQENYQIYVHDQYTVFGITGTVSEDKLPVMGAFLEVFSNYSYNETREVYFETALKGRYARDEASRRMLDLIVDSIYIDAGWIYSYCLEDFALILRNLVRAKNTNWASDYCAKGNMMNIKLKDLNEDYGGN